MLVEREAYHTSNPGAEKTSGMPLPSGLSWIVSRLSRTVEKIIVGMRLGRRYLLIVTAASLSW